MARARHRRVARAVGLGGAPAPAEDAREEAEEGGVAVPARTAVAVAAPVRAYTAVVGLPDDVISRIRELADARADVCAVYLFGSHVKGEVAPGSDIDLGVLYRSRQPLETTLIFEQAIEQTLGHDVDLVDVARAGAFLALDVVKGERVYCREPAKADVFELHVLRRAGDLLPFERQRQAMLLDQRS